MSKKKAKFANTWVNLTTLGKAFGLSSVAVGKKLKEAGLREADGKPTKEALEQGYATKTPLKDGTPFFMWHRQKVRQFLEGQGVQSISRKQQQINELSRDLLAIDRSFQQATYRVEEDVFREEWHITVKEVRKLGLVNEVNVILKEKGCKSLIEGE